MSTNDLNMFLGSADAARFVGLASDTMKHMRNDDKRRAARGEEPKGPPCVQRGSRYYYRLSDLEKWMERSTTPLVPARQGNTAVA